MNAQVGSFKQTNYNPGFQVFLKFSQFRQLAAGDCFTFCDENMFSLQDGFLQIDSKNPDFPDVPAAYLGNRNEFAFADGHSEVHKWQTTALSAVPYKHGVSGGNASATPGGKNNLDWIWFTGHATVPQ
jgi:hypothetical protein